MQNFNQTFPHAIPCYTPNQIYALEKNWFKLNDSFGLMQQASWQMAHFIKTKSLKNNFPQNPQTVLIAVGNGNNGGDGWVLATFLTQLCPNWQISVLEIAPPTTENAKQAKSLFNGNIFDLDNFLTLQKTLNFHFDIIIDGLFGIGLNKQPKGDFAKIIHWINTYKQRFENCQIIAIDVPSGLNATDGKVYDKTAIKADITLCLLARKVGLYLQDSKDYVGQIVDLPLIPVTQATDFYYHTHVPTFPKRQNNTHKGSYGHVLIIGGNQLESGDEAGQAMAGASLLSASCAFATGVGKVTVACHTNFHNAIITALPNAMTADLHNVNSVANLIESVDVIALGMGFGRDKQSFDLFKSYLTAILTAKKSCIIDADGLYHLASLAQSKSKADKNLLKNVKKANLYFTPHSGEAGRLLDCDYSQIDSDKISALKNLTEKFGGTWLIKGTNTLVLEHEKLHICGLGNAGMATAGMGDCLAGVVAGLLAQKEILQDDYPLLTATLIHAKAGDNLAQKNGETALSANDMAEQIGKVLFDR